MSGLTSSRTLLSIIFPLSTSSARSIQLFLSSSVQSECSLSWLVLTRSPISLSLSSHHTACRKLKMKCVGGTETKPCNRCARTGKEVSNTSNFSSLIRKEMSYFRSDHPTSVRPSRTSKEKAFIQERCRNLSSQSSTSRYGRESRRR